MLPSLTAYASAKPNAIATPMPTWPTWKDACRKPRHSVSVSWLQTGYFPWTATLPRWTRFATLPRNTTRWSWWTNHTPAGVVGPTGHGVKRTIRHLRTRGHLYRNFGQSLWRRFGRIHYRTQGNHRPAAPTQPSVPLLQLIGSGHHRRQPRGIQDAQREQCPA